MAVLAAIKIFAGLLPHLIDSSGTERDSSSLHEPAPESASALLPRRDILHHGPHQRELEHLRGLRLA
jgi:hypothetical protein